MFVKNDKIRHLVFYYFIIKNIYSCQSPLPRHLYQASFFILIKFIASPKRISKYFPKYYYWQKHDI